MSMHKDNGSSENEPFDGGSIYVNSKTQDNSYQGAPSMEALLLPLEDEVFFPYIQVAARITHPDSILTARKAFKEHMPVFFFLAPESMPDETRQVVLDDIYECQGCVGNVLEFHMNDDGSASFIAATAHQGELIGFDCQMPFMSGLIRFIFPEKIKNSDKEEETAGRLKTLYDTILRHLRDNDRKQMSEHLAIFQEDAVRRLSFIIQNSPLTVEQRYELLTCPSFSERRSLLVEMLDVETEHLAIRADLHNKAMNEIGTRQRDEFLRAQMHQIKNELGESDDADLEELQARASTKEWNDETRERFNKEMRKLERFNPTTPDYAVQYAYIDTYLNLP